MDLSKQTELSIKCERSQSVTHLKYKRDRCSLMFQMIVDLVYRTLIQLQFFRTCTSIWGKDKSASANKQAIRTENTGPIAYKNCYLLSLHCPKMH